MNILDLLKPAPYAKEIEDQETVKKQYRYWRWRVFIAMYFGYAFYYFSRKSFTFAMPSMMKDLGFDKSELGIVGSALAISYGVSKFLSGMLTDKSNPRFLMGCGLILTGIFNFFFGASSSILFFVLFWALNGLFQGWGSPPCARLLTYWYSQKERGTWWGVWNTSHGLGGALIPLIAVFCAEHWGWRYSLYVPGALCIGMGFFLMIRLRDTPQSVGLPAIEDFKGEARVKKTEDKSNSSLKEILFQHVLSNKFIWILAISYFFVYVIRTAINDWSLLFLVETKGYSLLAAGSCVCWFEVGGIVGSLAAGWASDKIFGGRRGPINILFSFGVILAIAAFWFSPPGMFLLDSILLFVIGFLIFGPQMLIGLAAVELSSKKAAATATGFVGLPAYLGTAAAGYPLGKMAQEWGWEGFFVTLAICGAVSVFILLPLWSVYSRPKEEPVAT